MIDARVKELLNPSVLNTVSGLELVARVIVEGFMSGSNKSQSVGSGQEFSQYRNYQPGDDLRQLDWKMFARSERYYIKEAEIETNITVKFMLDASRSMAYAEGELSKIQYAKVLMAALAFLARKQSDTFGLFAVNDQQINTLLPRFEQQQFMRFLLELINIQGDGKWENSGREEQLFDHHGKEMIVFFTDMYDVEGDLQRFISRLKTSRNEVVIFHLMGKHEQELDYEGSLTFEDLETNVRTKVNTVLQKKEYAARVANWIQDTRMWMLEKDISYHVVTLQQGAESVLRDFLVTRKRLAR
ncbi:MAG TPA: DUF58 domain-containing protein [Cytophagales bacterium]|nr:DUF58 domain-containing protein [Cytophagales bacterium]HRG10229.1 DUF58 domain-containing protein [Cyclobacteriaceae bacterium]